MFSTLRRITTLLVMVFDFFWRGIKLPSDEVISVVVMVLAAAVAGVGDLQFSFLGYLFCFLNCVFTAGFLVSTRKAKADTHLGDVALLFYPNLTAIGFMVLLAWVSGEFDGLALWPREFASNPMFWVCLSMSAVQAFILNYATFLCSNHNSPLATSVTGQIKNIAQISLGMVWFGDVQYDPLNTVGLVIGIVASIWYGYLKYQQTASRKPILPAGISEPARRV
eukprot:GAFH01002771.1.p1 GENE.GAFH01002771.1~~GAFH01002771.1.p1  ORF type:complete len:223 (+),score=76.90 GAFH01002771.1:331-999(+)